MPTLMPSDTRNALGQNAEKCESRSLLLDRFVYDHPEMNEARKLHFAQVCADSFAVINATREIWRKTTEDPRARPRDREQARKFLADTEGLGARTGFVEAEQPSEASASHQKFFALLGKCETLYAQLQSRLMVNMAGGVMENAGLCLDRFGLPYIPGSAVKGCARRMAIQLLFERAAGFQPTTGAEDLTAKSKRWDECAQLLVKIARVFGWCEQDWKDGSDFAYACGKADWEEVRERAVKLLFDANPNWRKPTGNQPLWKALPNFAGSVSFLPAYPVDLGKTGKVDGLPLEVPPLGKLELDVVTCHHREYYAGNPQYATAPDTEEPVPVVFPAVAPGHVFIFAVLPGRRCGDGLLDAAKKWLATGLSVFGLGAKTAAGYGWFDASEEFNRTTRAVLAKAQQAEQERLARERAEAEQQARAEAERQKREAEQKALASMTPEQQQDYKIAQLSDQQLDSKLQQFTKLPEAEAAAIVRALHGPRATAWAKLKERGQKGQWAQVLQAVYALNKKLNLGKMP